MVDVDQRLYRHSANKKTKWLWIVVAAITMMSCRGRVVTAWSLVGRSERWAPFIQRYGFSRDRVCSASTSVRLFATTHTEEVTNDPKLWEGRSHSSSVFVTHVLAGPDQPTVVEAIRSRVNIKGEHEETALPRNNTNLTASQLLQLGSVWFLSRDSPRDPKFGEKPRRLTADNSTLILHEGDYLRIHHSPRRFPEVHDYDWSQSTLDGETTKPGVIVARDNEKGYLVVNKPAGVPVHATVDNCLENVADCIRMQNEYEYVSTPQRLDQNTSGLLVVATKKSFAAYYAKLLRTKTDQQLNLSSSSKSAIHKSYKCLVCILPPKGEGKNNADGQWSMTGAIDRLTSFASNGTVMRHYLEPSIRAPKHFARVPGNESWAESLLRIVHVGDLCPLVGSQAGKELAAKLWKNHEAKPVDCIGVVELEVELLTGRTHQIRGQLSTEGFPLVGDSQYGGAVEPQEGMSQPISSQTHSHQLALQCSQLEFLDPDMVIKDEACTEVGYISTRWNSFCLKRAWWSPFLDMFREQAANGPATTNAADKEQVQILREDAKAKQSPELEKGSAIDIFPRVELSPGIHKYVLIKAKKNENGSRKTYWFVKSASPSECGGPYHANVAENLVERLKTYFDSVVVAGGGRIEYHNEAPAHAHVYGFSYGFGKGDHALAARVIEEESNHAIVATFDNADGLY